MACLALVVAVVASPAQTPLDSNIRSLQARLKLYPTDFRSCDQLGAAYIQKGRETADASYFELARDALNKSLDLVSNDLPAASAKTHLAVVAMAEHQFQEALGWAQEALALGSGDPSAWAIAGDALTDMGEYDRAAEAYARLRDPLHPEEEATALVYERLSRQAYLRFIRGDAAGAINLMREATALAATLHLPAENVAWSQYQLGELCFKSGDLAGAEQAYRAGLNVQPNSYRNLAGLGEVRSAQEKYAEAIAFYQKAIAVAPYPSFAAALYDLNLRAGRSDEARKQLALIEFIVRLNPVNERLFYRELALFYADHDLKLKESLDLARKELEVRHDVYTWDILAWVLYKNGRAREAGEAMEKALAPGTRDALLDYHAGLIEFELGHDAHARSLLESALALSPHFPAAYSGQARQILERIASGDLESRVRR
jgi:tetratricopeptide (TPR) repeat protein